MVVLDFHSDFQLLDLSVSVSRLEASCAVQNSLEKITSHALALLFLTFYLEM